MLKIDAKIRRSKCSKEEMLHLVGKTPSCPEKPIAEWPLIFEKERFMYAELFPLYRELEKEAGIDENNVIDILPSFIGSRNSLQPNAKPDQDSILLMENLIVKGFYNADKRTGMNVQHARKALVSLARYHVLGIAMKQKRPTFAKKAIDQAQILGIDFAQFDNVHASTREVLVNTPSLKKNLAVIEFSFEQAKNGGSWKAQPMEPWATITHGDFWTNNMLFHKDNKGNVDEVKFVDFQIYVYSSPLKDVSRFIGCSIDAVTQANNLEELLNLYYDTFMKTLKRMGCDASLFSRESFDREVKKQAISEFPICALSNKFFVSEIIDENMSNEENINNVVNAKPNDAFIDRLMWLVKVYERMKWF